MKKVFFIIVWMIAISSMVFASAHIEDGLCSVFLSGDDGVYLSVLEMQRDTLRDGAAFQYYQNGDVEKIAWYDAGKLHGVFRSFWADGQARSLMEYRFGVLHGSVRHFDRDGRLQMEFVYSDGRLKDTGYYYEEGVFKNAVMYEDGKAVEIF